MNDNEKYLGRLQDLKSEEMLLETKLADGLNTLEEDEIQELNNRLTGVRIEKEEIEQLMSGAFF